MDSVEPNADTHYVTSEDELRALAHPLRLRLLGLLRVDGPATASGLGERVGESSGVTSYHLRYLADRNFVEEALDMGTRRERWWRAAQRSTAWDSADFLDSREGRAADLAFRREGLRHTRALVDDWMVDEATWPREWVSAATTSDVVLRLSVGQLKDFNNDYRSLIAKYTAVSDANDEHHREDTVRVVVIMHAVPMRDSQP